MGAPAVLQICHLNQLTGVLVARRGSQSVRIAFRHGQVVSAIGPDHEGPLVVYDFIGWPQGQFEFDRDAVIEGTPIAADFNALLLEGCRRLDERRRGRPVDADLDPGPAVDAPRASRIASAAPGVARADRGRTRRPGPGETR